MLYQDAIASRQTSYPLISVHTCLTHGGYGYRFEYLDTPNHVSYLRFYLDLTNNVDGSLDTLNKVNKVRHTRPICLVWGTMPLLYPNKSGILIESQNRIFIFLQIEIYLTSMDHRRHHYSVSVDVHDPLDIVTTDFAFYSRTLHLPHSLISLIFQIVMMLGFSRTL